MEHTIGLDTHANASAGALSVASWRDFADPAGWDALAARAAEPNPFAERWCLAPALAAFDPSGTAQLAHYSVGGATAGLVPLARVPQYDRYPLPHIAGWLHANAFLGAPLVAAGHEHGFWRELLGWADTQRRRRAVPPSRGAARRRPALRRAARCLRLAGPRRCGGAPPRTRAAALGPRPRSLFRCVDERQEAQGAAPPVQPPRGRRHGRDRAARAMPRVSKHGSPNSSRSRRRGGRAPKAPRSRANPPRRASSQKRCRALPRQASSSG